MSAAEDLEHLLLQREAGRLSPEEFDRRVTRRLDALRGIEPPPDSPAVSRPRWISWRRRFFQRAAPSR